jgi:hypothetical protein
MGVNNANKGDIKQTDAKALNIYGKRPAVNEVKSADTKRIDK